MKAELQKLKVGEKDLVIINADKLVLHGSVVSAMDEARKAGVTRFAIATEKE
ncbi:MAG: biopolymer transporter ExbD [Armatimonadetes bacterium]|nr:biopolymer transporter ExbD [Armatimonadota bacterium]